MTNVTRKNTSSINKYWIDHGELNSRKYEDQIVFELFKEDNTIESAKIEARNLSMSDTSKAKMKWFDWFRI